MSADLVSILMPVKDTESYLADCLHSIRKQSHTNIELIAVDDGSSDASRAILEEVAKEDARVRWYPNEGSGIIPALRTAYKHASGQWIHRMDSDDLMPPQKIQRLLEASRKGVVSTGKVEYFSDDWLVGIGFRNYEAWINSLMDREELWTDVYMECPIPSPAWMLHRSDLDRIGAFDSDLLPEDYDLCFRIYQAGLKVRTVKEVVHLWRDHQVRTSRKMPIYFPMSYYPLKLHYFLSIDRDRKKPLYLWGAGKKGKLLAQLLLEKKEDFIWITDNERKIGIDIHGKHVEAVPEGKRGEAQWILAVASPGDKAMMVDRLEDWNLRKAEDYWWFC